MPEHMRIYEIANLRRSSFGNSSHGDADFTPGRHLAVSRVIFVCHKCYWHIIGRVEAKHASEHLRVHKIAPCNRVTPSRMSVVLRLRNSGLWEPGCIVTTQSTVLAESPI